MSTKEEQLAVIATICEALPREELNNDVARGIAFAVGYISQAGTEQEANDEH
ncbi:hypothetical protein [Brevibacterium oceani]|uniref:hypothetical protein n=1 Tax=Brevibacterium oceani TaxID=358099 RepID=UPI0015E6B907|nr:hypothetical protein [Brevibacterium oceani]